VCCAPLLAQGDATLPEHVIVLSIDGLMPETYSGGDTGFPAPNVRELAAKGCASPGIAPIFPSVTYPNHTTIVTGVSPIRHGIDENFQFDPFRKLSSGWYNYAEMITVPTLWDLVRQAGGKSAAVFWPVTRGAQIDFLWPDVTGTESPDAPYNARALSTPGLLREVEREYGRLELGSDRAFAQAAAHIMKKHRPRLLLAHFWELDLAQHRAGPASAQARDALKRVDENLGFLRQEIARAGLAEKVAWVVVSDHGFAPVEQHFHPRVVIRRLGLARFKEKSPDTLEDYRVWVRGGGGSFALVAKDASDRQAIDAATQEFRQLAADPRNGIARLYTRDELRKMSAGYRDAFIVGSMQPGFAAGGRSDSDLLTPAQGGSHGHAPDTPGLVASLIFYGKGTRPCKSLPDARMIDIAPTIARLLGLAMPSAEGRPVGMALQ
jgi:predicted AlkP superfamily pyrophosphatase or phosphodiesterase